MYCLVIWLLRLLISCFLFEVSISSDLLTRDKPIRDGDVLVSGGENFALGFFSTPLSSTNRYVGIWYNKVSERTIVWVANRDNPINDTSGVLSIDSYGNIVIHQKNETTPTWSAANVLSVTSANNSVAQLRDSGNLVLFQDNTRSSALWQSFDHPTDTLLPLMKHGLNRTSGLNRFITSWKSQDDPGTGTITYKLNPEGTPQLFMYKNQTPIYRADPILVQRWSGIPRIHDNPVLDVNFINNQEEAAFVTNMSNPSIFSRVVVRESGILELLTWKEKTQKWVSVFRVPRGQCSNYAYCGANGNCGNYEFGQFECECLPGFTPRLPNDWNFRDASGGCVRKSKESICRNGEGFLKVPNVMTPDTSAAYVNMSMTLKDCGTECLRNCSCTAYANAAELTGGEKGCLMWSGDLFDLRKFPDVEHDLYIRVGALELARIKKKGFYSKERLPIMVVSITTAAIIAIAVSILLMKKQRKGSQNAEYLHGATKNQELPSVEVSTIIEATDDFASANKLGEGGFGAVYKGRLASGQEIAVKKLSKNSGQGSEEFKTEVMLIAKLQHRNLVRLLGYCANKDERMLVYEYMPNKSLDVFIFDKDKRPALDWNSRFRIISGIARGMLYLHQDSRLRIIHRDLKPSNILLDSLMNPIISDFGMARIFGAEQIQANTEWIIGTHGYMSPEYAVQGLYSIKSDVFSFGVILLETINGRRNTDCHYDNSCLTLIEHVWNLWQVEKSLDAVDPLMGQVYNSHQVLRCINIGLLCVQECAADRPTMMDIVYMLDNEATPPSPHRPAFILSGSRGNLDLAIAAGASKNYVTISEVDGR